MRVALLALALAAAVPSCRCGSKQQTRADSRIEVGRLSTSWVVVIDEMRVERDEGKERELEKILARKVEAHSRIRSGVAGRDPLELAVVVGDEPIGQVDAGTRTEEIGTLATFTLRTTYADGWRISSSVLTDLEDTKPGATGPILEDLLDGLADQLDLFEMDVDALLETLENRDCTWDDVCATTVRLLGERGDGRAVPLLVSMLEDTQGGDPLFEDLVGALGRLGDERASPALVEAWGRAAPSIQVVVLQAIAACGGDEARLFLEVVASGHESPTMREQALMGLESMDKAAGRR